MSFTEVSGAVARHSHVFRRPFQALSGEGTDDFIFPLFTKQGERVEVLLNATPRCNEAAAVVGVLGVGQDITRITKAQKELRQVANDLRLLIETANAPIFGIDT